MRIREITLAKGEAHLHFDLDAGGRATRLAIGDLDVLASPDPSSPFHWGSFVMAPWAGRVRDGRFQTGGVTHELPISMPPHAIHGTVADRPWWCVEHTETEAVIDCPLDERWPWRGFVRQVVELDEQSVDFRIELHADDAPFPASVGWHPWFARQLSSRGSPRGGAAQRDQGNRRGARRRLAGEPLEFAVTADSVLVRDESGIPTGERGLVPEQPWDDCFDGLTWPVTLTWPGALQLDVSADTQYAVLYTEPEDAICVEPQTGPPDALNLEPTIVRPGEPLTAAMRWEWQSL